MGESPTPRKAGLIFIFWRLKSHKAHDRLNLTVQSRIIILHFCFSHLLPSAGISQGCTMLSSCMLRKHPNQLSYTPRLTFTFGGGVVKV